MTDPRGGVDLSAYDPDAFTRGDYDQLQAEADDDIDAPPTFMDRLVQAVDDEDLSWWDDALCRIDLKPDTTTHAQWVARWFPAGSDEFNGHKLQARHYPGYAACQACPVSDECLEAHISEKAGMFGGTTPQDRKRLRRQRSRTGPDGRHTRLLPIRDEVERLVRVGASDGQIASRLKVSINVVRDYRQQAGLIRDRQGRLVEGGAA